MWPFKRKDSLLSSGIFFGYTDFHSHILPGVDDGVQSLSESLIILDRLELMGVRTVWCTPHIMEDIPNKTRDLQASFAALCEAYAAEGGHIELHLASENMLDTLFERRLAEEDVLPLGPRGDQLLVETSYYNPPMHFHALLQEIKQAGYTTVLAHPERYNYMDDAEYDAVKAMGVRFQLNLYSLAGCYGPAVRAKALRLLSRGLYDLSGTDTHSLSQLQKACATKNIDKNLLAKLPLDNIH